MNTLIRFFMQKYFCVTFLISYQIKKLYEVAEIIETSYGDIIYEINCQRPFFP